MLKDRIAAALKQHPVDLVITNIQVVDVFTQDIFIADIAVKDGVIVGVGEYRGQGREELDGSGKFIVPGLIDAHVHLESTLVTPAEYSNVVLPRGVTGVVADPHEIANVSGVAGIRFMVESGRQAPLDIYWMLPSCVPATAFEHAGCCLAASDLFPLYNLAGMLGLAEVMDAPAVFGGDSDMLQKIEDAKSLGRPVDGHMAGFGVEQLNGYGVAGIRTDHECDSVAGLQDRVRRGIYTLVREGTVCRDLDILLPAINERNAPMLCFATDDKHLDDLCAVGGVDASVRLAIAKGLHPATAIQMASLNVARCYGLANVGAIAPGYRADFSIVEDLRALTIERVYKSGLLVASQGRMLKSADPAAVRAGQTLLSSVNLPEIGSEDLSIKMRGCRKARVIELVPGTVVTNQLVTEVDVEDGRFVVDVERDLVKIAVFERHRGIGSSSCAIVTGLRLAKGAIATTIAHDSHNLLVAGVSDADMLKAIETIRQMQGGIAVVADGRTLASLVLEIGGLMTGRRANEVLGDLKRLHKAVRTVAPRCHFNPFLALSFMSLVVIPHLKLSDSGLFDVTAFSFTEVPVPD